MNYFKVVVKCGHVGKNKFIIQDLFVEAENGKEAAKIARQTGRVKHHHKDAIRAVEKISREEYLMGKQANKLNNYFKAKNIQEQRKECPDIYKEVYREEETIIYKETHIRSRLVTESRIKEWKKELKREIC